MIDSNTIARIIDAAEITEVVGEFVSLKKRGVNYIGLCPFHNEKTPSFIVSPAKGIFKCFGCSKGGNSVNFVMEHEQLSYPDALKYLAKKFNIEVVDKELTPEEIIVNNERESMLLVVGFAQRFFSDFLHNTNEGKAIGQSYFKHRAIRNDMVERFELGFSPEQRDALTNAALKAGYKLEYLEKTGLTIVKDNWKFDRFAGRVIFPIHNLAGRVIAFGGRVLKTDNKKVAKYQNSIESEIYHKSNILYGIFQAKKSIVQHDKCFLVEGYTDVIAMHQAGIENVVASSGTSLTVNQILLVKRFTLNLTILYDGDAAGIKAALRGIDLVFKEGMNVRVVLLPDGEDPDSFSKKQNATDFQKFISENEEDFIRFKTRLLLKETENDPVGRATLIHNIATTISVIPDGIIRSVYVKDCSALLNVKEEALYSEINNLRGNKTAEAIKRADYQSEIQQKQKKEIDYNLLANNNICEKNERELVFLLVSFGSEVLFTNKHNEEYNLELQEDESITVADFIISSINEEREILLFSNRLYHKIYIEYEHKYLDEDFRFEKHFIEHPDSEISILVSSLLMPTAELSKLWSKGGAYINTEKYDLKKAVPWAVLHYKDRKTIALMDEILQQLKTAKDAIEMDELLQKHKFLKEINQIYSKDLGNRVIVR